MSAMTNATTTKTVGTGTETVTYDVHGDLADVTPDSPPLFMLASPMDAVRVHDPAQPLHRPVVVTYDPRGAAAATTVDTTPIPPEEHAKDLHAVIADLGVGPVDVFASSGGAVNVPGTRRRPPRRRTHRRGPRAADLRLPPDRDNAIAACRDIGRLRRRGLPPAMAKFITTVMPQGRSPGSTSTPRPPTPRVRRAASDDGTAPTPC